MPRGPRDTQPLTFSDVLASRRAAYEPAVTRVYCVTPEEYAASMCRVSRPRTKTEKMGPIK